MNVALQTSNVMGNPIGGVFLFDNCLWRNHTLKEHWMGSFSPQKEKKTTTLNPKAALTEREKNNRQREK